MPVKIANSFSPYTPVGEALNGAITSYANSIPTYGEVQEGRINTNKADAPMEIGDQIRALYGNSGPDGQPLTPQMVQDNIAGLATAVSKGGDVGKLGDLLRVVVANSARPESVQMIDRAQQGAGQAYNTTETGFNKDQANDILKTKMQQDGANYRASVSAKVTAGAAKEAEKAKGRAAFQSILDEMRGDYGNLDKNGGLVSNKGNMLTNIRARFGASATGQMAGGFLGTENQTYRDNITSRLPLLKQAVMAATGMSAKQMDSNVEMKAFMQALSDPKQSKETVDQTLNTLGRLYGNGGEAGDAPSSGLGNVDNSGAIVPSGGTGEPIRKSIGGVNYVNYSGNPDDWEEE